MICEIMITLYMIKNIAFIAESFGFFFLFIYKFISINSKLKFLNLICSFYFQATVHIWLDINTFFCYYGLALECVLSIMRIIFFIKMMLLMSKFHSTFTHAFFSHFAVTRKHRSFYFGVLNEYKWKRTER